MPVLDTYFYELEAEKEFALEDYIRLDNYDDLVVIKLVP